MVAIFALPAWLRLLAALAYAGAVGLAVWLVDAAPQRQAPVPEAAPAATKAVEVRAEATFAVGRWTVLVDGVACPGQAAERSWSGTLGGREVLVQAERVDGGQAAGALRVLAGGRESLAWGEGTVSAELRIAR